MKNSGRRHEVTDDFRAQVLKKLASDEAALQRLEADIRARRIALNEYDKAYEKALAEIVSPSEEPTTPVIRTGPTRFQGVRPVWKAIKEVMGENNGRMSRQDLEDALVAGGVTIDRERNGNTRISIEKALASGKLKEDGDLLVWKG